MYRKKTLFKWDKIDTLGDLERLELYLKTLPDEEIITVFANRGTCGCNDYLVRTLWDSLWQGLYTSISIESMLREVNSNAKLVVYLD